jgi:hypothetical protein
MRVDRVDLAGRRVRFARMSLRHQVEDT